MNSLQIVTYATSIDQLHEIAKANVREVIFSTIELSRFGKLTRTQLIELALEAKKLNMKCVLEWDILMTEPKLKRAVNVMKSIDLTLFDAIRVQDAGALNYALHHTTLPIQLNLETGNHNLIGMKRWCALVGRRLDKIIVSIELTAEKLAEIIQTTQASVEVLGLGPILLLYTPRLLLSLERNHLDWLENDQNATEHHLQALADSNENAHSGFRIIENLNGTFVIHHKDYSLIEKIVELKQIGLHGLRIDLRQNKKSTSIKPLAELIENFSLTDATQYIENYEYKVTHCFYRANATDVLFKKLKNMNIQRKDSGYVGEVIEVSKNNYISVQVNGKKSTLSTGQNYKVVTPEGDELSLQPYKLTALNGKTIDKALNDDIVILPYQKSVVVKSLIYTN